MKITVTVTATERHPDGRYVHDVEFTDSDGTRYARIESDHEAAEFARAEQAHVDAIYGN